MPKSTTDPTPHRLTLHQRECLRRIHRFNDGNRYAFPAGSQGSGCLSALRKHGYITTETENEGKDNETIYASMTELGRHAITPKTPGRPRQHTDRAAKQAEYRTRKADTEKAELDKMQAELEELRLIKQEVCKVGNVTYYTYHNTDRSTGPDAEP